MTTPLTTPLDQILAPTGLLDLNGQRMTNAADASADTDLVNRRTGDARWVLAGGGAQAYYAPTGVTGATAASRYVGATASGAPTTGTFAIGDFVIDQTGHMWVCTAAGTPGTWANTGVAGLSRNYALVTASGSWAIPAGITHIRLRTVDGGCGGGSGAVCTASVNASGGGGGGGGVVIDQELELNPADTSLTITIGGAGAGGTPGNAGSIGTSTTVIGAQSGTVYSSGGGTNRSTGGAKGVTSFPSNAAGGAYGSCVNVPGAGGSGNLQAVPAPNGPVVGGSGGANLTANQVNGAVGGNAQLLANPLQGPTGNGGAASGANGGTGITATKPGCGGGGGGAAGVGGTGGTAGNGAGGSFEAWW